MKDKISIIVPIYNVEKYLADCMESLINQTYENIEIILIDDGSTDNSPEICDQYCKKDNRIIVIHKENEGLSAARNLGADKAKGKYIAFIDSDDLVSLDYIDILYENIIKYNSDIAVVKYQRFKSNKDIAEIKNITENKIINLNMIEYVERALYQNNQTLYSVAAWGKLYNTSIFKNIKYPTGKLNEDLAVILELEKYSKRVVCIDSIKYYYRISKNSITTQKFNQKKLDIIEILYSLQKEIDKNYPNLKNAIINFTYSRSADLLRDIIDSKDRNKEIEEELWNNVKKYRNLIITDKKSRKIARISCLISYCGKTFFLLVLRIFKKIKYIKNIQ